VALNRRLYLGHDVPADYDPLAADPDYLVVGPLGRAWRLYDRAVAAGDFQPVARFAVYEVLQRVRR
jgi:hypothetical protein